MMYRNIFRILKKRKILLSKFTSHNDIPLGRWNHQNNNNEKVLNRKIYLANHDNCGPCGTILFSNEEKQN